jgi:hypothetical protein
VVDFEERKKVKQATSENSARIQRNSDKMSKDFSPEITDRCNRRLHIRDFFLCALTDKNKFGSGIRTACTRRARRLIRGVSLGHPDHNSDSLTNVRVGSKFGS